MSLTQEETRLFAALWMGAGQNAVLHPCDAPLVVAHAIKGPMMRLAHGATPCARTLAQAKADGDDKGRHGQDRRAGGHSSWVH